MKVIDLQEVWNEMNREDIENIKDEKVTSTTYKVKTGSGWDDLWDDDCCCCLGGYSK